MRPCSSRYSITQAKNPATSETSIAPAPHEPNGQPMICATYAYTGMNAQAFSATCPDSVSGSCDGYPAYATSQYHWASQPSTNLSMLASAPKRESEPES